MKRGFFRNRREHLLGAFGVPCLSLLQAEFRSLNNLKNLSLFYYFSFFLSIKINIFMSFYYIVNIRASLLEEPVTTKSDLLERLFETLLRDTYDYLVSGLRIKCPSSSPSCGCVYARVCVVAV